MKKTKRQKSGRRQRARREISAGGLVWRRNGNDGIEVVLVKPAGRETWVMPKGHLKPGETLEQAAVRECLEETGLSARIDDTLGEVSYYFSEREGGKPVTIFKRVHFFLMRFKSGDTADHDDEISEVSWLPINEALARATFAKERELIGKARQALS